ncbi:MAG TPA: glycosyltransferase family 4 protein [Thermoleophilia bacterium]|nr:glycosyltransferase family 4 protein [Thermoleophilia bacterium]
MTSALFVTNFCPHYHVRLFELLGQRLDITFLFVSRGREWYWDPRHGVRTGEFKHEYLAQPRGNPALVGYRLINRLWSTRPRVIICALSGRFSLAATYLSARIRRLPFVLWTGLWMHPQTVVHRLSFPVLRHLYRHSTAVVVYGKHVKEYLAGLNVDPARIFVAPHALDNDLYDRMVDPATLESLRVEYGLSGRSVILFVGRLTAVKGLPILIEAASQLRDLAPVVVFVGEGEMRAELERQAAEAGVDTRFVGYVTTGELYRFYALANVFVLPSVTVKQGRELWGLVINEAMNQGVPVVATDSVGAIRGGLVRHGETGLVVPEGDAVALGAALRRIFVDNELARRLGEAGRREVENWTTQRMADAFLEAVRFALAGRGQGADANTLAQRSGPEQTR